MCQRFAAVIAPVLPRDCLCFISSLFHHSVNQSGSTSSKSGFDCTHAASFQTYYFQSDLITATFIRV